MRKVWIFSLPYLLTASLFSQQQTSKPAPLVPPEEIERQLDDAEREFRDAKKMFNPWYTGPLLTPSAHMCPPGTVITQPYFFYIDNYAHFDEHGKSHRVPHLDVTK